MTQAANNSRHGYYQRKAAQIGPAGDFVTAPELTQLFGEMVAVWLVSVWEALGRPDNVRLVELGPGTGVLMRDVLRTLSRFPAMRKAVQVHLVELSQPLRRLQAATLCGAEYEGPQTPESVTVEGTTVTWHPFLSEVPADGPLLLVAQEFLDVFPVHQFGLGVRGWTEKLVDVCDSPDSRLHFRMVLAPSPTPACHAILAARSDPLSPYSFLSKVVDSAAGKLGDGMQVSPLALAVVEQVALRIRDAGGAALFLDYGEDRHQTDTLRGFRRHEVVDALSLPGLTDVTCDVDFAACAHVARLRGAMVAPLLSQGEFLMRMGIAQRLERVFAMPGTTEEQARALFEAFKMVAGHEPGQMGAKFKALRIASPEIAGGVEGL